MAEALCNFNAGVGVRRAESNRGNPGRAGQLVEASVACLCPRGCQVIMLSARVVQLGWRACLDSCCPWTHSRSSLEWSGAGNAEAEQAGMCTRYIHLQEELLPYGGEPRLAGCAADLFGSRGVGCPGSSRVAAAVRACNRAANAAGVSRVGAWGTPRVLGSRAGR